MLGAEEILTDPSFNKINPPVCDDVIDYMATCPKGLENILAKELIALGAQLVKESVAACYFSAELSTAYNICLWSRIANRILVLFKKTQLESLDELQLTVTELRWSDWFSPDQTIAVDFNGSNHYIRDSRYGAQITKDAINDHFQRQGEKRLTVDTDKPDILIYVRLFKARFSIGIDLVGESLHRRGYRRSTGSAPLKENLAAAILMLAEWPSLSAEEKPFIDPMCGSGTLLIEAALIANAIAPSYLRGFFSLQHLKNYEPELWQKLQAKARESLENAGQCKSVIVGYDQDRKTIALCKENIAAAGLQAFIQVEQQSIENLSSINKLNPEKSNGLVVVNPPYGKRLGDIETLDALYKQLGDWLKRDCLGWNAAVFTGNVDLGWSTRLRSWRQHGLYNGSIHCQLQRYKIEEKNFIAGRKPDTGIVQQSTLSDSAQMLANRIKKNLRKLKSWLRENPDICYRVYDADLPEYAVAIDCYSAWVLDDDESSEMSNHKSLSKDKPQYYFHVQEYAAPSSIDTRVAKKRLRDVLHVVSAVFDVTLESIILKQRQRQRGATQYEKQETANQFLLVKEDQSRFLINLEQYLDTGLFLDYRPVRRHLAANIRGKRFLNLFAYTSTATVYAAKAGAVSSVSVDMSKTYTQWSARNFALNALPVWEHQLITADCLQWLRQEPSKRFDCILLDPPSFSNSKRMQTTLDIQRDHVELINLCIEWLADGGCLYFSNNRKGFKLDNSLHEHYSIEDISRETHDPDFDRPKTAHHCWIIRCL